MTKHICYVAKGGDTLPHPVSLDEKKPPIKQKTKTKGLGSHFPSSVDRLIFELHFLIAIKILQSFSKHG